MNVNFMLTDAYDFMKISWWLLNFEDK